MSCILTQFVYFLVVIFNLYLYPLNIHKQDVRMKCSIRLKVNIFSHQYFIGEAVSFVHHLTAKSIRMKKTGEGKTRLMGRNKKPMDEVEVRLHLR